MAQPDQDRAVAELSRLIEGIPIVMVTTVGAPADNHVLRCRPMLLERLDPDGTLIFLTHLSSQKARELDEDPRVNVAFIGEKPERYISVSGRASVARDSARLRTLWNPTYRAWFPGGPDDPDAALLRVAVERVEYWDVPSSRLVRLWGVVRALASGQPAEAGEHRTFVFGDANPQTST